MTIFGFALLGLRGSLLTQILNVFLLGLGLGTVTLLILVTGALADRLVRDAKQVDLVVGAKGSPLQLVLSAVFQADIPTGNIALLDADAVRKDPMVASAVPVALGDAAHGFRIVGTSADYLGFYHGHLDQGRLWDQPMEAVLGADTAAALKLGLGDHFAGAHGIGGEGHLHSEHPYVVTGILAPSGSVLDRLVLTSVESVWKIHEDHHHAGNDGDRHEITALLLRLRSPLGVITLTHRINTATDMEAASPTLEYARLLSLAGIGVDFFKALAGVLIVTSGLGTLIALYTRLRAREQDMAILRLLGASPLQLFVSVILEAMFLAGAGAVLGLLLGHLGIVLARLYLPSGHALSSMSLGWRPEEGLVPLLALVTGLAAAAIPAVTAYRIPVGTALSGAEL